MFKKVLIICAIIILSLSFSYAEDESTINENIGLDIKVASYSKTSVTLEWSNQECNYYDVYIYSEEIEDYLLLGSTNDNYYTFDNLEVGKRYQAKICENNNISNYKIFAFATRPEKVKSLDEKNVLTKKAYLSWNESGIYSGFQIKYSRKKNFENSKVTYSKTLEKRILNLKKKKTYYVKVRAYIEVDGLKYYGEWSNTKKFVFHELIKKNKITYADGLMIVNKSYNIPSSYGSGIKEVTNNAFTKMKKAAKKDGVILSITSGYRSYKYQKSLYKSYCSQYGKKAADTFSARAGYSEHQTGYALDINTINDSFGKSKAGKWLAKNGYKYGFIIRYPENKEKYTGYKYESWHIRYVGKEFAKTLYNDGDWISIEEYFNIRSEYK